jgi:hypothetical protein
MLDTGIVKDTILEIRGCEMFLGMCSMARVVK